MKNFSDPIFPPYVDPESFKVQLKKLSGKSLAGKSSKTASALERWVEPQKTALTKPQKTKTQHLKGQVDQDNPSDEVQSGDANSTSTDAPVQNPLLSLSEEPAKSDLSANSASNSLNIASLSTYQTIDEIKTSEASLESEGKRPTDIAIAQASPATLMPEAVATSVPPFSLPGLGAGFSALALATTPTTPTDISKISTTLTGFIAAGPVINNAGLKVEAFDASGNLLASTASIQADGTFSISLKNSYTGVVKLVVSDTNGSDFNFIDEATGKGKSLGTDPLVTIFNLAAGQTTFSVNINPLTTEAASYLMSAVGNDLTKATSSSISNANLQVASEYGFSDASNPDELLIDKPTLLIDLNGKMNAKWDMDIYGLILAIRSVQDDDPNMQMKDAVKALAQNPLYSGWSKDSIDWANFVYKFGSQFLNLKNDDPISSLTISGTPAQNQQLTAPTITDLDGIPATGAAGALSYQWQSSPDGTTNWTDISGATAPTFTTTQDQVNKFVRVVAKYTDKFGTTEIVTSNATTAVTTNISVPQQRDATGSLHPLTVDQINTAHSFSAKDVNGDGLSDWIFAFKGDANTLGKAIVVYGNIEGYYDLAAITAGDTSKGQLISEVPTCNKNESNKNPNYYLNQIGFLPISVGDMRADGTGLIAIAPTELELYSHSANYPPIKLYGINLTNPVDITHIDPSPNQPLSDGVFSVNSGDINGDGLSDFVVGKPLENLVYVVYGNKNLTNTDVSNPGFGFKITDSNANLNDTQFGFGVSYLGDVNGDGYGDIAISKVQYDTRIPSTITVIFGSGILNDIDIVSIQNNANLGFQIIADPKLPQIGFTMSRDGTQVSGDFNGDGLSDFIFSGTSKDTVFLSESEKNAYVYDGKFYVLYGSQNPKNINLDKFDKTQGFVIKLPSINDLQTYAGVGYSQIYKTSNAGDINGDGIDDILISLSWDTKISGNLSEKENHFSSYIVYGNPKDFEIDLASFSSQGNLNGFELINETKKIQKSNTESADGLYQGSVTAAGDINGDGLPDFLVDDYKADNGLIPKVIFGSLSMHGAVASQPIARWMVDQLGDNNKNQLTGTTNNETFVGGAGDDTIEGNGGADVMYGGAGNDIFVINQGNISKLETPIGSNNRLARINGGAGLDTIELNGSNITFDLTKVSSDRIQSIEKITLAGNDDKNQLVISWHNIQCMSAINVFNNHNGWTQLCNDNKSLFHQLLIEGGGGNTLNIHKDHWTSSKVMNDKGVEYQIYTDTTHNVQLLVNANLSVI